MSDTDTQSRSSRLRTTRVALWIPLALLAALALALVALPVVAHKAEREREAAVQEAAARADAERSALNRRAEDALARASGEAHRLFGVALAWAIRSAWMRNNFDELEQYVAELVKRDGIRLVALADHTGTIVVSSDLNLKDTEFTRHFPEALLRDPTVSVHDAGGTTRRMTVPIQGLNSRLGTALVVYDAPALGTP